MTTITENNKQIRKKKPRDTVGDGAMMKAKKSSFLKLHKKNFDNDVVYLYQFTRTPRLPSLSSNCLKLETWLRLVGITYVNMDNKMGLKTHRTQYPFVEFNGEQVYDSGAIIEELSGRFGCNLDAELSPQQRSVSHAMVSMLDNHLAWVITWWRSKHPSRVLKGYQVNLQHFLGTKVPKPILDFFFKSNFKRKGKRRAKAQGIGKHSSDEIMELGNKDLDALESFLGKSSFFFGAEPTSVDVAAFAHLAQIYFISNNIDFPLRDYLLKHCPNLIRFIHHMKTRCFPDWDAICKTRNTTTEHVNSKAPVQVK